MGQTIKSVQAQFNSLQSSVENLQLQIDNNQNKINYYTSIYPPNIFSFYNSYKKYINTAEYNIRPSWYEMYAGSEGVTFFLDETTSQIPEPSEENGDNSEVQIEEEGGD